MSPGDRYSATGALVMSVLSLTTDYILLLPSLPPAESEALSSLFALLLPLEQLFPRNRLSEYVPLWQQYKLVPQLLELDLQAILGLWRNGRLKASGWDAVDLMQILERRFGHNADGVIQEIRRDYLS
jgi:hypothetical protein